MDKIGNFEKLVADLIADSEHGSELYDYIHQQGRLVDIRGGDGWVSWSNTQHGVITLGVGEQPPEHLGWLAPQCENQWQALQHRLLHEMAHLATLTHMDGGNFPDRHPAIQEFVSKLSDIRQEHRYRLGVSAIGSLGFYDSNVRPIEDAADLVALAARGDEPIAQHMANLVAQPAEINSRLGLVTLGADAIMELAERTNGALRHIGIVKK